MWREEGFRCQVDRGRSRQCSTKSLWAFGEVVETRVVLDSVRGHKCTVAYSSRSAAEFAKEAMTGQSLRPDGGELVQVRWAKEQASTSETGKFSFVDVHAGRAAPAARARRPRGISAGGLVQHVRRRVASCVLPRRGRVPRDVGAADGAGALGRASRSSTSGLAAALRRRARLRLLPQHVERRDDVGSALLV